MLEISKSFNNIGASFSSVYPNIYSDFKINKDPEIFERLVFDLILNKYSKDDDLSRYILDLPKEKQRIALLALMDTKEKNNDNVLWAEMNSYVKENVDKFDHISDVIKIMSKFVKDGKIEKKLYGEVMTPIKLVRKMLLKLPESVWSNPNLKWFDPANGAGTFPYVVIYKLMLGLREWEPDNEKRYKHIVENMIYTCELQSRNVFLWLCGVDPKDEYTTNTYWGSFLDDGFDKHMREVWKLESFDIIIGNPPFNQMIDMDFIKKSHRLSDVILFVHPSTWLLDEKCKQRKFNDVKNLIGDHLETIELFNGNKTFNIVLAVPCCITHINKNKKNKGIKCTDVLNNVELVYDDIKEINKFSNLDIYPSLKNKIILRLDNDLNSIVKNKNNNNFYVNMSQITGNVFTNSDEFMVKDDFYTLCGKEIKTTSNPEKQFVSFINEKEADNFISYIKTKFVRFCLSILKNNKNVHRGEMAFIPWLDFTQEWTDEKLYKHFSITEEEIKFIEKHIPKYY
jgi:hypothetical protein